MKPLSVVKTIHPDQSAKAGDSAPAVLPVRKSSANLKPPWQKGQSGNPRGKPIGSRHKLATQFVDDLLRIYSERGYEILERLAEDEPGRFIELIAKLLPRHSEIDLSDTARVDVVLSVDQRKRIAENWLLSKAG